MANTRDHLYRKGKRFINVSAPYTAESRSNSAEGESKINTDGSALNDADSYSLDKTFIEDIDVPGPNRQVIKNPPTKIQRRINDVREFNRAVIEFVLKQWGRVWHLRPWREKSEIELQREIEIAERKKLARTLTKESRIFARRASTAYARMGLCYVPPVHRRNIFNGIQKVEFSNIVAEPNAIWLQIATDRLPWGVDILKCIQDEGVMTNLSASLRHHVQGMYDVEKGAWLCIERGRGTRGIPREVTFEKMYNLLPKNSHRLTIPFGETVNSRRLYRSLRDFPHLLIGGSTGQGKTTFLNTIMASLIKSNTPEDIKIVLVDLKNGIEFSMYKGVPHLWKMGGSGKSEDEEIAPEGIVGRPETAIRLLHRLKAEGERRLELFRKLEVTNIDEYNKTRRKTRMARIVVMIDEWARIALSPEGKLADNILSDICATYRAVGFHVILATQVPITKVISTLIKTNFNARLAFGVPTITASQVILDSKRATGLSPVGRAIFQYGTEVTETQVPYLRKGELLEIIEESKRDGGRVEETVSVLEMFRYSIKNLDGSLAGQRLYEHFGDRIGKSALEDRLKTMDEMLVDIDGVEFVIQPPYGNVPRRLEIYEGDEDIDPPVED